MTGAAGFISSNFVLEWHGEGGKPVASHDALTYAGNLDSLSTLKGDQRHAFTRGHNADAWLVSDLLASHLHRAVLNFAAGNQVDRFIEGRGLRADQRAGHAAPPRGREGVLGWAARGAAERLPLPSHLD